MLREQVAREGQNTLGRAVALPKRFHDDGAEDGVAQFVDRGVGGQLSVAYARPQPGSEVLLHAETGTEMPADRRVLRRGGDE